MFCSNCGKPTEGDQTLCAECAAQTPVTEETTPAEETVIQEETAVQEETAPQEEVPTFTVASDIPQPPAPKKKKGGLIAAIAVVAVLAIAAITAVLNLDALTNLYYSTFASPQEYLIHVEEKALFDTLDEFAQIYGLTTGSADGVNGTLKLRLSESTLAMLETYMATQGLETDWSFLSNVNMNFSAQTNEDTQQFLLSLLLDEQKVLSLDLIASPEQIFLALPELNPAYLGIAVEEGAAISSALFVKDLPDAKTLAELPREYISLAINSLEDVTKEKVTLSLEGAEQEVTALTATVTEDDARDICVALLEKLLDDKNAKEVLVALASAYDNGVEDLAASLDEALETAIAELQSEELEGNDNYMEFIVYVDAQGDVVGNEVNFYTVVDSETETTTIRYITVTEGETTYRNLSDNDGTLLDGVSENGTDTYRFYADGTQAFTLEVRDWNSSEDALSCTFVFTPYAEEEASFYTALGGAPAIQVKMDCKKSEYAADISLMAGTNEVFSLSTKYTTGASAPIQIPTESVDTTDMDAFYAYMEEMDIDQVLTNLEDGGMPEELTEMVAYMFYSMIYGISY